MTRLYYISLHTKYNSQIIYCIKNKFNSRGLGLKSWKLSIFIYLFCSLTYENSYNKVRAKSLLIDYLSHNSLHVFNRFIIKDMCMFSNTLIENKSIMNKIKICYSLTLEIKLYLCIVLLESHICWRILLKRHYLGINRFDHIMILFEIYLWRIVLIHFSISLNHQKLVYCGNFKPR